MTFSGKYYNVRKVGPCANTVEEKCGRNQEPIFGGDWEIVMNASGKFNKKYI